LPRLARTNLTSSDHATVNVRVVAQPDGSTFIMPSELNPRFDLNGENGIWRIDDIGSSTQPSVRTYLSVSNESIRDRCPDDCVRIGNRG
jgi:hypothetical protein